MDTDYGRIHVATVQLIMCAMDSLCAVGADCAGAYGEWRSEKSFATNESTVSICGKAATVTESCIIYR